jgi:hypothetical protein
MPQGSQEVVSQEVDFLAFQIWWAIVVGCLHAITNVIKTRFMRIIKKS